MAYERKDSFHQRAKREGFRSRAAYKLDELQREHRLLRSGDRVVDLGCWPGGWMQVASAIVGPSGRVVGIDLADLDPLPLENAIALRGDLTDPGVAQRLLEALGRPADVVLSDAVPRPTARARRRSSRRSSRSCRSSCAAAARSSRSCLRRRSRRPSRAGSARGSRRRASRNLR